MFSFKRILCPTDFSEPSARAIEFAAFLSGESAGHLKLLYVDEFARGATGVFAEKDEREEHASRVSRIAEENFQKLIRRTGLPPERISTIVRVGTSYQEIIEEAEVNRFSAVVIATDGLGGTSPELLGRTAERVIRLCRAPVLSLRPGPEGAARSVKTILCPTDFSEYANYALPYAASLAHRFGARIVLLHATDLMVQHPELLVEKFPDLSVYHEKGGEIPTERLVGRDVEPENTIVRIAEEYHADLIVMGTHGARGMRRVQIGNTTEEVVRRTAVPVLTVTHPIHKQIFPRRFGEDSGGRT